MISPWFVQTHFFPYRLHLSQPFPSHKKLNPLCPVLFPQQCLQLTQQNLSSFSVPSHGTRSSSEKCYHWDLSLELPLSSCWELLWFCLEQLFPIPFLLTALWFLPTARGVVLSPALTRVPVASKFPTLACFLLACALCTCSVIYMSRKACSGVFSTYEFHVAGTFCWLPNFRWEPTIEISSIDLIVFITPIIIPQLYVCSLPGQLPTRWM